MMTRMARLMRLLPRKFSVMTGMFLLLLVLLLSLQEDPPEGRSKMTTYMVEEALS